MDLDNLNRAEYAKIAAKWSSALRLPEIRQLASSYNSDKRCFLGEPIEGSFNRCYPVDFDDGTRWIIRFPIPGKVVCVEEKLRSEVATMLFVKKNTNLKVPKVVGWGFEGGNHPSRSAFLLMERMEGVPLAHYRITRLGEAARNHVFKQVAEIMLSLSDLRFHRIGSLTLDTQDKPALAARPQSQASNGLMLDGVNVSNIFPPNETFSSADQYILKTANLMKARLYEQRNSIYNREDGEQKFCAQHLFKSVIQEYAQDGPGEPFVLMHGDLRPSNILLDPESFDVTGLIDWEWTRVVPMRLVTPPFWLHDVPINLFSQADPAPYLKQVAIFLSHLKALEAARLLVEGIMLSEVIEKMFDDPSRFWIGLSLNNPYYFDDIFWDRINRLTVNPDSKNDDEIVHEFMQGAQRAETLTSIEAKMMQLGEYRALQESTQ